MKILCYYSFDTLKDLNKKFKFLVCLVLFVRIPKTIGASIPMKATFFITFIMVDGWAGIAGEVLRLKPLIIFHLKNFFLVKTEKDREEAMDPGSIGFDSSEPQIQLYFLLGLAYAVVTPFLLPFIIIFFGLAYVVFRHQVCNSHVLPLCIGLLYKIEISLIRSRLVLLPFSKSCKLKFCAMECAGKCTSPSLLLLVCLPCNHLLSA